MLDNIEYRICYREKNNLDTIAIYEVILDNLGNVIYISDNPVYPIGATIEQFSDSMQKYVNALKQPILNYNRLKNLVTLNVTYHHELQNSKQVN